MAGAARGADSHEAVQVEENIGGNLLRAKGFLHPLCRIMPLPFARMDGDGNWMTGKYA
jgi:hypothetical protein